MLENLKDSAEKKIEVTLLSNFAVIYLDSTNHLIYFAALEKWLHFDMPILDIIIFLSLKLHYFDLNLSVNLQLFENVCF